MQPDTLAAMVGFIRRRLAKAVDVGAGRFLAISETAERFNDTTWFWTDDNAKAAELLACPSLYDADPAAADSAIDFVLRMSEGAIIGRRCAPPELRVISSDPRAFRIETAFFILEGDLSSGLVRHSLRFNDGRTVVAAQYTGNKVSVGVRDGWLTRRAGLDVEDAVDGFGVEVRDGEVELWHSSRLVLPAHPWLRRAPMPLGHVRYGYRAGVHSPAVTLRVELRLDPDVALVDCAMTTALDNLGSVPPIVYRSVGVRAGGVDKVLPTLPELWTTVHEGPADYALIAQVGESPGFSYGIHTMMRDGAKLERVRVRCKKREVLHWAGHRYRVGALAAGGAVTLTEERMVTGGGYYDALGHYEAVLREGTGGGGNDPSMTYDIGAELNAVAAQILFARAGRYAKPPGAERLAELQAWYDRHVERYFAFIRPDAQDCMSRVFTRGLAFVALSLDCMLRATGQARYRAQLQTAVQLIMRTGRRQACGRDEQDRTFVDIWAGRVPFLDNHASCILALARAAWHGDPDGALSEAVHEGILGIKLCTRVVDLGNGHTVATDSLATLNDPVNDHADTGFWNFKLGMVLRAMRAALRAADAGKLNLNADARRRLLLRRDLCESLLAQSERWHEQDGERIMEVLTSRIAGETNSETQPWVALGLVPVVDEEIVALPVP